MKVESIEQIIEFLNSKGIKTNYDNSGKHFNRVVSFEVENREFFIEWWINQCYLKLENKFSSVNLPFKFISVNPYSPTSLHEFQLCFYDEEIKGDKSSMLYNPIPFGSFKIPFNK